MEFELELDGESTTHLKTLSVQAAQLILTVPASIYSDIQFDDELLSPKMQAQFNQWGYATITKILLPVQSTESAWGVGSSDSGISWLTEKKKVLTLYYGGKFGNQYSTKDLSTRAQKEKSFLNSVYPGMKWESLEKISIPKEMQFSSYNNGVGLNWSQERYSMGAYSYRSAWSSTETEVTVQICGETSLSVFQPIQNRLFFAGEHTSLTFPSTMEGAVESGERTARMFVNCISPPSQGVNFVPKPR